MGVPVYIGDRIEMAEIFFEVLCIIDTHFKRIGQKTTFYIFAAAVCPVHQELRVESSSEFINTENIIEFRVIVIFQVKGKNPHPGEVDGQKNFFDIQFIGFGRIDCLDLIYRLSARCYYVFVLPEDFAFFFLWKYNIPRKIIKVDIFIEIRGTGNFEKVFLPG